MLRDPVPSWMNWVDPVCTDLRVFLLVLLSIKAVLPKKACYRVSLVLTSTVRALEGVQAWFAFFGFKAWQINFIIGLIAPAEFTMVLWFLGTIALDILWTLDPTRKNWMALFPAVFTLWDTRVCISSSNCYNIPSNVEAPIDKIFSFCTTLYVPDVYPNNHHV